MAEKIKRRLSKTTGPAAEDCIEFGISGIAGVSSSAGVNRPDAVETGAVAATPFADVEGLDTTAHSPAFLELADPKLPELPKESRAKLLMQSPTRLYFYWSAGKNPFHTLNRAIGDTGSYSLVLRLVNLRTDAENIYPAESSGSWWFDVDADSEYRAEIGFYAVNRPWVRILYSNTVATPRKSPSPRSADSAQWTVSADRFAQVLDAAGFERDAFDVALTGDDERAAELATLAAFSQFIGKPRSVFDSFSLEELRFALLSLASGVSIFGLRGRISAGLHAVLERETSGRTDEDALAALRSHFDIDAADLDEEESGSAVFGSSLINFPRTLKRRRRKLSEFGPVSSLRIAKRYQ